MGFFDTVKAKAGALASDAERAGRVTAAQARLVVLQNDLRKAERELGHETFALIERGAVDHSELAGAAARLREILAEVRGKEAEIAAQRGMAKPSAQPKEPAARSTSAPEAAAANVEGTTVQVVPAADLADAEAAASESVAEAPEAAPTAPARKAATKAAPRAAAAKSGTAKKPAAKKPAAKKAPAKPAARPAARRPAAKKAPRPKTEEND